MISGNDKPGQYGHRLLVLLLSPVLALLMMLVDPKITNALTLLGAGDFVSSTAPSAPGVVHSISFLTPLSGHQIIPTDYIIITFANYSDVTPATSSVGWTGGTPIYSVLGNQVFITGVSAIQGSGITISGITTTNPPTGQSAIVKVEIADDSSGTTVYDSVNIAPIPANRNTTTSVTVISFSSSFEFYGYTSPNAFVTILLNGSVAGTTVADVNGNFYKLIAGLQGATLYNISVYAQDQSLRDTQSLTFQATSLNDMNLIFSNVTIPTTFDIAPRTFFQGDFLNLQGSAHPYSQVTLFIEGSNDHSFVVQTDEDGKWTYKMDTRIYKLNVGPHIAYAKEVVQGGYTSIFTQEEAFEVKSCRIADLNCDKHVDLTDFSILMYYWKKPNPANHRADVNADSKVDLVDFSLMMFYWTG